VIICAEVLYYIMEKDARKACYRLKQHLASDGIIIEVSGIPIGKPNPLYCHEWERILCREFLLVHKDVVQASSRPYTITVFSAGGKR
jgi:hypothetical protein